VPGQAQDQRLLSTTLAVSGGALERVSRAQTIIIADFHERALPQYPRRFEALAVTQGGGWLFVTCSVSRVVPELLPPTEPNDLFVMRIADLK
jgi:carbonic anhydrase